MADPCGQERGQLLKRFTESYFKTVAQVVVGEPPADFKNMAGREKSGRLQKAGASELVEGEAGEIDSGVEAEEDGEGTGRVFVCVCERGSDAWKARRVQRGNGRGSSRRLGTGSVVICRARPRGGSRKRPRNSWRTGLGLVPD